MTNSSPETLLTIGAVALRAHVSPTTVRLWAESKRLPCVRTEGRCGLRLFRESDVIELLAARGERQREALSA